jgi:stearoyl-CoA desaturase (delta-9 desaturase)
MARPSADDARFDPLAAGPLIAMHGAALAVLWTGVSGVALAVAAVLFVARAFGLTAGYHRYFAHRSYRTSRIGQLALGLLGASAAQMGPLWWAGHHRLHHRHSDRTGDPHSPVTGSLYWAHIGWLLCRRHAATPLGAMRDFARFPELVWLDRWHAVAPAAVALGCWALGAALAARGFATSGAQMLIVGFLLGTLALYHVTYAVNSLAHRFGTRRYDAEDGSRNHALLALVSLGDGWHNNHHRFPRAARHGFFWWELDPTWLGLRALAALGFVSDLVPVPAEAYAERRPSAIPASTPAPHATPNESPIRV